MTLNFIRVNAQERFYARLKGVERAQEAKHGEIIGEEFIRVFEVEEAKKIGAVGLPGTGNHLPGCD